MTARVRLAIIQLQGKYDVSLTARFLGGVLVSESCLAALVE
jgi:hypothetical protein